MTKKNPNISYFCHVNSNDEGDNFVGVKSEDKNTKIYFPLGYNLPTEEYQIQRDIRKLLQLLSLFSKKENVLNRDSFEAKYYVDFPIFAYIQVIDYYCEYGYYNEYERTYIQSGKGQTNWSRTIKNNNPLVQSNGAFIYTKRTVVSSTQNENTIITDIFKYCLHEAIDKIGIIYRNIQPLENDKILSQKPNSNHWIHILNYKINTTNQDIKRNLFVAMKAVITHLINSSNSKILYFGTDSFQTVWEGIINIAFGIKNKKEYLPRTKWTLNYGNEKNKHPLIPDTIMVAQDKYYILDAKYYRYGRTGDANHLPNGTDINKQITYGEYLKIQKNVENDKLYNAFIMPYNKNSNCFGEDNIDVLKIGEAIGEWKTGEFYFEHIQGILIDTRELIYNFDSNNSKLKMKLVKCIEKDITLSNTTT